MKLSDAAGMRLDLMQRGARWKITELTSNSGKPFLCIIYTTLELVLLKKHDIYDNKVVYVKTIVSLY